MSNGKFQIKNNSRFNIYKIIFLGVVFFGLVYFLVKSFTASLFFKNSDRLNLIIYNKQPVLFSIGLKDRVNYSLVFYPDLRVKVPGGYGYYRVGALEKLIELENKPQLLSRTFSALTNSFVTQSFYDSTTQIYYGDRSKNMVAQIPSFISLFTMKSETGFLNKIFIALQFIGRRPYEFIPMQIDEKMVNKDSFALNEVFDQAYQGYFYQKTLRNEKLNVQLFYNMNYDATLVMSKLIEGNGVRVVDISQTDKPISNCQITVNDRAYRSYSSQILSTFFNCTVQKGGTTVSDIIIKIGEKEKEWD